MEQLLNLVNRNIGLFLLILLRISGLFVVSPLFGRRDIPAAFKIGFTLIMSFLVLESIGSHSSIVIQNIWEFSLLCFKELLIGWIIGYIVNLFFSAILTAGQIMDTQIGFGMMNIFDPQINAQVPLMGNFLNLLTILIFLSLNGHYTLIKVLIHTFDVIAPGKVNITPAITKDIVDIFSMTFVMAVQISMPVIIAAFLSEVAMGIIVRTVPQMNVFVVGIPLKLFIGLVMLFLFIPIYLSLLNGIFDQMFHRLELVLQGLVSR